MSQWLHCCALVLLVPSAAAAQPSRDEAIRLLLSGDYPRAVEALRPLAEDPRKPDAAAQFLLAMLYDSGHGVPRNGFRACGLFLQAAAAESPFSQAAAVLGVRLKAEMGPMADQLCAPGPWHDMPAAFFTLGPNHSVQFTSNGIVVRYAGAERRIGTGMMPGMIPLPVLYTPLDVVHPVQERRHFFQSFLWVPDNPSAPASWTLGWGLTEIAGTDYVFIASERNVLSVTGAKPPATLDLSSVARVRVDAGGAAEWIVAGGANPRTGVIPRRESR